MKRIIMNKYLIFGLILALLSSCQQNSRVEHVERAFYHWKNQSVYYENVKHLKELKIEKLYIKLFEVDYSTTRGNFPFSKYKPRYYEFDNIDSIQIVPTIFIKNGIFQFNDEKSLDKLADNIVYLVQKYSEEDRFNNNTRTIFTYDEIQIDCDWTKSTQDKYFYLLKKIKELSGKEISCTLRLYPYKYPKEMGVPPVDKAMLMCYNLIKPLSQENKNSILDLEELKSYLDKRKSYPVHLDIALPTFYWTQMYQNNQFTQLVDLSTKDVKKISKPIKPLWYEVVNDTSIDYDTYLRVGDQLKCEDVSSETLNKAIDLIRKNVALDKRTTISLFDLDESTFKQYTHEELSGFYNRFMEH